MALSTQPYKGARDFYPEDKRLQKYLFGTISKVLERYGYQEYDAPILEPTELYLTKGNEEIINEQTYSFVDRSERRVTMRTEMTPTVSRMVAARRQELAYPVRWYSIPQCWRYERMQKGRGREFYQLNVDVFGLAGLEAEHEVLMTVSAVMHAFGANQEMYTIKINHRQLVNYIMETYLGLEQVQTQSLGKLIDRMRKMDYAEFVAQVDGLMSPSQREAGSTDHLLGLLKVTVLEEMPEELKQHESFQQLQKLFTMLGKSHITNAEFDLTIMRGFDYYTGIVFEVFDNDQDNNRSMFGGGRYDGLVGLFGAEPVPTVGYAMGDITLMNFLEAHNLTPKLRNEADVFVALAGDDIYEAAQTPIEKLRDMGLNVVVDSSGRKLGNQLKAADKMGIRYAIIVGERELSEEQFVLRDMHDASEEKHSLERLTSIVKDYRKK